MSRRELLEEKKMKNLIYVFAIAVVISIVTFILVFVSYNKKLKEQSRESLLELGKVNSIVPNNEISQTSYSEDKGKEDVQEENTSNTSNNVKPNIENKKTVKNTEAVSSVVNKEESNSIENEEVIQNNENTIAMENNTSTEVLQNKELEFGVPVSGEIIKDFAKDTLVYSNTLEEWTTHTGIDIKADKTTVVLSAEEGVIESIKNDPRYGISIVIKHENGFKTVYSNLLTTEFIKEGETVEKGQTIATVGDSASFEILDESHLHFEMYKDGESVNPTIYLK